MNNSPRTHRLPAIIALLTAVLGVTLATSRPARADPRRDAEIAIRAAYRAIDRAAERRDADAALSYDCPNYRCITTYGRVIDLMHQRHITRLFLHNAQKAVSVSKIQHLTLQGTRTIVTVRFHHEVTLATTSHANGKPVTFVEDATARETWHLTGHKWLRCLSRGLTYHALMNGKPLPPNTP